MNTMYNNLHQLLEQLRFRGIKEKLDNILASAEKTGASTSEVIKLLLEEEYRYRQERSIQYRLNQAKLPWTWSLDTFPFQKQPGVNKTQIQNLANLAFIERSENIVLIGDPGTGKSGLAIGLLRQALVKGYRGYFCDAQALLNKLYSSFADRYTHQLVKKLSRFDVLLIDKFSYLTISNEQASAFFNLIEMRYQKKSTIITTNLDYPNWCGH